MTLMHRAGLDPWAMVSMLENLSQFSRSQPRLLQWTASHPPAEDRINDARRQAESLTGSRAFDNQSQFFSDDNNRPRRRHQRRG